MSIRKTLKETGERVGDFLNKEAYGVAKKNVEGADEVFDRVIKYYNIYANVYGFVESGMSDAEFVNTHGEDIQFVCDSANRIIDSSERLVRREEMKRQIKELRSVTEDDASLEEFLNLCSDEVLESMLDDGDARE